MERGQLSGDLGRLVGLIERAETILRRHGDRQWADWLRHDAAQLRARDMGGLRHFLGAFGGMGSINDLGGEPTFHENLDPALDAAYALAKSLLTATSQRRDV